MARQSNAAYWAQRLKNMEGALLDQSFGYVENMERQFAAAQAEVERQIAAWYQRFADANGIAFADAKRLLTKRELAEFHWTVGEYIAHGQQNALDGAWIKQLESASARVHITRLEALKLQIQQQAELLYANQLDFVDAAARRIYAGSYYGTAFEVQRGLGVGWTMQALNEGTVKKVLSRPWTVDGQTFRDRCWTNKRDLVNSVNTQLTQMIIRGEAPDRAIAAVAKQFQVSKGKAGRLIMTESAYFASAAQKDCYGELGVERYKIVASFDQDTCGLCGAMDSQVFKMSEYQVGLTAPPFHPWCRCCTAPYFEDMAALGARWTRNRDGTAAKVPADMSFDEWRDRFVQNAPGKDFVEIFQPIGDYIRPDGNFDLDAAKADYEKFLQTVPERNRMYLQQAMTGVEYQQTKNLDAVFAYTAKKDTILFNPGHPMFSAYDLRAVMTHELGHRIDHTMFIQSWTSEAFSAAITDARAVIDADPQKFLAFAKSDVNGFLSDILSAICEDNYRFDAFHEKSYWLKPGNKEKEIFANLFSLETFGDKTSLNFFRESFPGIWSEYSDFWK